MTTLPPLKRFVSNSGVRIYRIACRVFEHLTARVYLLLGAGPPTLVDAGSSFLESTNHILQGLETIRTEFHEPIHLHDIGRIIITHRHIDHYGGVEELFRRTGAEVGVHPLDRAVIASGAEANALSRRGLLDFLQRAGMDQSRRLAMLKMTHFHEKPIEGVPVVWDLLDGMELDGLRFIHTPGHSPGHVCIAIGNVIISADHILAQTIPQQWPESTAPFTGLAHYLESLDKVQRFGEFDLALAAHEQVIHHVSARIETIRAAHHRRLERLLDMMHQHARPMSLLEISHELYPDVTGFRSFLAITDVGSRVEYLHEHGHLVVVNLDEVDQQDQPVFRYAVS